MLWVPQTRGTSSVLSTIATAPLLRWVHSVNFLHTDPVFPVNFLHTDPVFPAGEVIIESKWGDAVAKNTATVKAGDSVEVDVIFNAGILEISVVEGAIGGKPINEGTIGVYSATKDLEGRRKLVASRSDRKFRLNAGSYHVELTYQGRKGTVDVEVKAGESQNATLVIPSE